MKIVSKPVIFPGWGGIHRSKWSICEEEKKFFVYRELLKCDSVERTKSRSWQHSEINGIFVGSIKLIANVFEISAAREILSVSRTSHAKRAAESLFPAPTCNLTSPKKLVRLRLSHSRQSLRWNSKGCQLNEIGGNVFDITHTELHHCWDENRWHNSAPRYKENSNQKDLNFVVAVLSDFWVREVKLMQNFFGWRHISVATNDFNILRATSSLIRRWCQNKFAGVWRNGIWKGDFCN